MKQQVMKLAWVLFQEYVPTMENWSHALTQAWTVVKLKRQLSKGSVNFQFIKKDLSVRAAHGTTNMSLIPTGMHSKGTGTTSPKVTPFFDLDKQEWRSFNNKTLA